MQYQHEKPDETLKLYKLNRELFADDNTVYSRLALALMERGNLVESKKIGQQVLDINPTDELAMELLK